MSTYEIAVEREFSEPEIKTLYESVGWSVYTRDMDQLIAGLGNSTRVVTARENGELIGLARMLSDGHTIAYLQDVLVDPRYQGRGLGRRLVEAVLQPYSHVRQTVLLTDSEDAQRAFYESLGFTETRDFDGFELRAFVKFRS